MSLLANSAVIGGEVDVGDIGHSLRFRGAQSLGRTFSGGTANGIVAISCWVRRGALGVRQELLGVDSGTPWYSTYLEFQANDTLHFWTYSGGSVTRFGWITTRVFRDPTAWTHLFILMDTSQSGQSSRRLWVNGVEETAFTAEVSGYNSVGMNHYVLSAGAANGHEIGKAAFNGYFARWCVVAGSASVNSFGYLNSETNEWVSKTQAQVKAVVDAGGANSFMLDFDDGTSLTTLGQDNSSKGNNWTLMYFSLTAGVDYDHMLDVPGNSYATLNPLNQSIVNAAASILSSGNLQLNSGGGAYAYGGYYSTFSISIPMYCELQPIINNAAVTLGVVKAGHRNTTTYLTPNIYFICLPASSSIYINGASFQTGLPAITSSDVLGMSFDPYTGTVKFYRNGVQIGADLTTPVDEYCVSAYSQTSAGGLGSACHINFGQRPFTHTPPTGFKALCQANLPTPAILNPEVHMDVITVTKSGNTNFTIPWNATDYDTLFEIKSRGATGNWYQIDGLRGYNKYLSSNTTAAEVTDANVLTVSGATGTLGSTLADGTYVITMYKAGLASARQTNTAGSITSTVSANIAAGFSIVSFALQATGSKTVGHGLTSAPEFLVFKSLTGTYNWFEYDAISGPTKFMNLNGTAAATVNSTVWDNTAPTSAVFTVGSGFTSAAYGTNQIAYCHHSVPGYSKIGSYTGNASADGPNPNLGFKPKVLTTKLTSAASGNWLRHDAARNPANPVNANLFMNVTNAEDTTSYLLPDFTGQSYKIRSTDAQGNGTSATYIYYAIADVAGKYSLGR